jgi:hypothetical protein
MRLHAIIFKDYQDDVNFPGSICHRISFSFVYSDIHAFDVDELGAGFICIVG